MNGLSPELIAQIFEFLKPEQILCVRCVCKFWDEVAKQTIEVRAKRGGPFIILKDSDRVPVSLTLPLFHTPSRKDHFVSHPSIVTVGEHVFEDPFLKKLTNCWLHLTHAWNAESLNQNALPQVKHLELTSTSVNNNITPGSFPKVTSLCIKGQCPPHLAAATPACTRLTVHFNDDDRKLAEHITAWPNIVTLKLVSCQTKLSGVLPKNLRELTLSWCNLGQLVAHYGRMMLHFSTLTDQIEQTAAVAHTVHHQSMDVIHQTQPSTMLLECLETLFVESPTRMETKLIAPNLRTLKLKNVGADFLDPNDCPSLTHLAMWFIEEQLNLARLAPSLRTLELADVRIPDWEFLQCVPRLEVLVLCDIKTLGPCRLPFEYLLSLKSLGIVAGNEGNKPEIANVNDIGGLPSLENLWLFDLNIADVAWLHGSSVKKLRLSGLKNVTSLSFIGALRFLEDLYVHNLDLVKSITDWKGASCLKRVELSRLDLHCLNLSETTIKHLRLKDMAWACETVLPTGLVRFDMRHWRLRSSVPVFTDKLRALRHLTFHAPGLSLDRRNFAIDTFVDPKRLKYVSLQGVAIDACVLSGLSLDYLELIVDRVCIVPEQAWSPRSLSAASVHVNVCTDDVPSLDFVNPAVLKEFKFAMWRDRSPPSLAPLRQCTNLAYLDLKCAVPTLDELREHPSLQEVNVSETAQYLDVSALLTCPRLIVANILTCQVKQAQVRALNEYLISKIPN